MTVNEGLWDRVIRIVAGLAFGFAAWYTWPGSLFWGSAVLSFVFLGIGFLLLVTGLTGYCPGYTMSGISTNKKVGA